MKKIIAIFATVALATAFVGCGGSVPVEEEPPNNDEGPDPEEENAEGGGGDVEGEGEE